MKSSSVLLRLADTLVFGKCPVASPNIDAAEPHLAAHNNRSLPTHDGPVSRAPSSLLGHYYTESLGTPILFVATSAATYRKPLHSTTSQP